MIGIKSSQLKSGFYRCPDDIKSFKFRVNFKQLSSSLSNSNEIDFNINQEETKTFIWQEKIFSRIEVEFYSKKENCFSENELKYHEIVSSGYGISGRIFSYVHDDNFDPNEEIVTWGKESNITELHDQISNLTLNKCAKVNHNHKVTNTGYDFHKSLSDSITNPVISTSYETMYIVADLSDLSSSAATPNVWLKSQYVLCSLKYDKHRKLLWLYPDFSPKNTTYLFDFHYEGKSHFEYSLENISPIKNSEDIKKEISVLKKIHRRNQEIRSQILGTNFIIPKKNILRVFIFLEITSAKNFDYDNIYIQYNIDLPENWQIEDQNKLHGTTQTCKTKGGENFASFGHCIEVCLDYKAQQDASDVPALPVIYFQVISHDYWGRFRTEGLSYNVIPVFHPGIKNITLQCFRMCSKSFSGELRRFFIGDYFNIDDLTWLAIPKEHEGRTINKFGVETISTGSIDIKLNIMTQSRSSKRFEINYDNFNDSPLSKSIAEVVMAFRRARAKMIKARKELLEANN